MTPEELEELQSRVGHRFADRSLLVRAMTHASVTDQRKDSNERLEFLGDAVVGLVIGEYLYEKYPARVTPGWFILKIDDPSAAPMVAKTIDDQFRNSSAPTKTGTEQAFAAGFASMWGNIKLLMSTIGMAVVFAILLVTANAMMMNQRERTSEVAVMKTVGFSDRRVFSLIIIEAAVISLTGAFIGLGLAVLLPIVTGFGNGGFFPGFRVTPGTVLVGSVVALVLTVASGVFPAWQAAKLPVVQALRRVE